MTIAKFWVYSVLTTTSGSEVTLSAVCRGKDNAEWATATPSGQIKMTINNKLAAEQFVPGEELYVEFRQAPKGIEG